MIIHVLMLIYSISVLSFIPNPKYNDHRRPLLLVLSFLFIAISGYKLSVNIHKSINDKFTASATNESMMLVLLIFGSALDLSIVSQRECFFETYKSDWRKPVIISIFTLNLIYSVSNIYRKIKPKTKDMSQKIELV